MQEHEVAKTIIAEDIEVTGSIKCESNIQFDGKLNGDINCIGDAIIGSTANVKGNISVNCATVLGQVNGNIIAKDKIELKTSAYVNGDIKSKRLTVEDGVTFVGKSEVNPSGVGTSRAHSRSEIDSSAHEISPANEVGSAPEDTDVSALKEEIRKNVKEEVKSKSTSFFGKR
ncbi:MAG: polymer-forming cytoskeletal protein [Kiritimatiellae bacterium]|nr:polymer-forming cytoskeletal protein [Kiritimatiellia bacterium]MDD5520121.1 polymer-forming cytoskeletal protein [Kiritimatiellia bacterium]